MQTVGFVGLGAMGSRMAKRLLDAGYTVTGWNRTASKVHLLREAGMRWGETPRAVAEASDVVFSMVSNTAALEEVVEGQNGILAGLGPKKVYVDMSTVSPDRSRALAAEVAKRGARMLDAPVSGSPLAVEEGKVSIFVGGEEEALNAVRHVLEAIGPTITYIGGSGQALVMKLAINLNLLVQMMGFSEGLLLAEKGGIPRETAMRAMLNSVIASPLLKYRGAYIANPPDEAWFDIAMMQKDARLALDLGRELEVPLPTLATDDEYLTAARAMGLAHKDFYIVYEVLARMAGMGH